VVKPLDLCRWLATLILPPKRDTPRRLLVPFSGSGSEMIGAFLAGWDEVIGIEREAEYVEIAKARLAYWTRQQKLDLELPAPRQAVEPAPAEQDTIFHRGYDHEAKGWTLEISK